MSNSNQKKRQTKADVDQDEVEVKNQYRKMFARSENKTSEKIEHVKEVAKEKLEELQEKFTKDD